MVQEDNLNILESTMLGSAGLWNRKLFECERGALAIQSCKIPQNHSGACCRKTLTKVGLHSSFSC